MHTGFLDKLTIKVLKKKKSKEVTPLKELQKSIQLCVDNYCYNLMIQEDVSVVKVLSLTENIVSTVEQLIGWLQTSIRYL